MKDFGSSKITNALLLAILVSAWMICGNCDKMGRTSSPHRDDLSGMGAAPTPSQPMMNPHATDNGDVGAADPQGNPNFNFQNMVFAALRCPSDATVTLADASCKGKEADTRRKFVDGLAGQNLPPRMMFDKIIEKFGEKALSDEALEIRKNNRR